MEVLSSSGTTGPVVAVIPAFNEERFIGSVVLAAKKYCNLVIVVDDGSSDRTADLAEAAGALVIRRPAQGGKGAALNTGFEAALRYRPRATVMLDGDAQHDPAEIVDVARPILEGWADVVVGSRFLAARRDTIPWWRQIGQIALTILTNQASGVRLSDSQTGYRAFSLEALRRLRFHSQGLSVESEMQFLLKGTNLRLAEVPIHVRYLDGNKRNPVVHGLSVVDTILGLMARRRPLLFFAVPGLLLAVGGLLLGYQAFHVVRATHQIPLVSTVLGMLALVIGLLLGVTGTILNTLEHFATRVTKEILDVARERPSTSWDEAGHHVDPVIHHSRQL
ncbi:MAG: glycosyltransferase family 2 protein [Firmicutes bacterium]|nr:glycosyltransferase family 2 protein [Bacillota bacterium]